VTAHANEPLRHVLADCAIGVDPDVERCYSSVIGGGAAKNSAALPTFNYI